jgi:predicted transposase/invertase (TIGR01784 family)
MPAVYINPKTDFAFKKIFGSKESKDILISFLNAILYDEQDAIQDLANSAGSPALYPIG